MNAKRAVQFLSLAGIVFALVQIRSVTSPSPAEAGPEVKARGAAFTHFPEGQARRIDFQTDDGSFAGLTPLEIQQQMRDWLLLSVVSDAGLDAKEAREALFELPPIRRGYLEPISNYEYGETRSRCLNGDQVIALIQKGDPRAEADQLASIADEQRKNLGKIPASFLVFEYELQPEEQIGLITRRRTVKGEELFTEAAGYQRQNIASTADLESFLAKVDDLTFVSLEGSGLALGGRRLRERMPRNLRVEDVAALWQSETAVQAIQRKLQDLKSHWEGMTYSTEAEKESLTDQIDQELKEFREENGNPVEGSGFSLDPTYDYEQLATLMPSLEKMVAEIGDENVLSASDVQKVAAALKERNAVPLLEVIDKLSRSDHSDSASIGYLFNALQEGARFQAARYDGALQGTEVGMVLFYTDLLAKLWALDYMDSAPRPEDVADFVPLLKVPVSPVYLKDLAELPGTRVWFGPQDQGFQTVAQGPQALFARNATRIYAASSNPLKPGEEAEPNAPSAAFLGWWNNHYESVARFEPQYQRLNEIMKWSLLVSWLNDQRRMDRLGFLESQQVDHSQWFPEWVKRQPDLRFSLWQSIEFYNPKKADFKGTKTEAMPILYSKSFPQAGGPRVVSGGVSLGSEKVFKARIPLPEEVPNLLKRSHLDYQAAEDIGADAFRLKTLEQTEFEFRQILAESAPLTAQAKAATKLRSSDVEISNLPFETKYRAAFSELHIDLQAGPTEVGRFSAVPTKNGFRVGFESLDLEQGGRLARQVVDGILAGRDPLRVIASESRVVAVLREPAGDGYLVRINGSDRWLRLAPEGAPSASIKEGVQMRVGGWRVGSDDTQRWTAAWIEDGVPPVQLGDGSYLVVDPPPNGGGGVAMEVSNRGPPPTSNPVELIFADTRVRARKDAGGRYYFLHQDLPEALRTDPSPLPELIRGEAADIDGSLTKLARGSYEAVGSDLLKDPILFKKRIQRYRADQIREAERLTEAGDYGEADRILVSLADTFGSDPDLSLRRALVQLSQGRSTTALDTLEESLSSGLRDAKPAIARINARLAQGNVSQAEQETLFRIGRGLEMRERTLRGSGPRMDTRFVLDSQGRLDFYTVLLDAKGKKVRLQDLQSRHVYLDVDAPELSNIDWSSPAVLRQDEAVSLGLEITELPSWEIAHAQPGAVEEAVTGHKYRLVSRANSLTPLVRYQPLQTEPCGGDADPQKSKCDPFVYLVTKRPGAPRG